MTDINARSGDGFSKEGESWFYSEIVKDHFFNPRNIFKTEEEGKEYEKTADGIGLVGSPACINGDTLIHVNFDIKRINALSSSNKVLSHDGTYNAITRFYHPKYKGKLINIKNQFGGVTATPDHLVYAIQIPKKSSFANNDYKRKVLVSWVHAEELKKGDICLYPISKEIRKRDYIEISQDKKTGDFTSTKIPEKIKVTQELLRLFGYFVAEGHTRKGEILFTFGVKERHLVDDTANIIKKIFNLETKVTVRNNRIDLSTNNIHLARYLKEHCGVRAYNKKIPEFILFLEPELQKSFLYGVWRGNGYINVYNVKPRAEYSTTSWLLTQELKVLLLRQRVGHSIYFEAAKTIQGVNHRECYKVHVGDFEALRKMAGVLKVKFSYPKVSRIAEHSWFDKDYFYTPIRKVEEMSFDGRLRNLEVDKTHSYVSDAFTLHNCGDGMKMFIKVDRKTNRITDIKWQTYGCATAIASTSAYSVMLTKNGGLTINEALAVKPKDIANFLGGIPPRKFHCSVLADKAFQEAVNNYYRNTNQIDKIKIDGVKIVDNILKITDKDIEHAVLDGATDFEAVQKKTKVGIHNKECIPEVNRLIEVYKEKYFGE